jgi:FkbM family methyltransferase
MDLPLWCRANTSDRQVFSQVFIEREYACLDGVASPRLIIDCGANVGYTSAYFLSRFPGAHVIAVEPDPGNFGMLESNLRGYGNRFTALQTAVWSHPVGLKLSRGANGDDRDWAVQVRPLRDGELPDVVATDIGGLLANSGFDRIDILKVDVEHAEVEIFGHGSAAWLDQVDNIAIELHGDDARDTFFRAVHPSEFTFRESGELTVANRSPKVQA